MPTRRGKDGRWRYRKMVHLLDGSTMRISGTPDINTRLAAEAAERVHIERALKEAAMPGQIRREVPTFRKFVEEQWLPVYPSSVGNRPTTVREKELHVRMYLTPAFGSLRLDAIRGEAVNRFFAHLRRPRAAGGSAGGVRKLSEKTIKNIRATLRRILASAVEWEMIDRVPQLPRVKVTDKGWDFFSREEAAKLISVARDGEERAILQFALDTGARAGEQLALEWGDIDWHNRLVVFRRSSTRGQVGPTKSGRERKVPLTDRLAEALRRIKHLRGKLVFCRVDGKPLTLWQLHERLWGACRRAGLREIRWHDLRHYPGRRIIPDEYLAGALLRRARLGQSSG